MCSNLHFNTKELILVWCLKLKKLLLRCSFQSYASKILSVLKNSVGINLGGTMLTTFKTLELVLNIL